MRLKKIKLSGFKSFVDPTTIPIENDLIGVVGPNGCGKSNIIDAVRWVMGEMSAKNLRGDSMADVIFNGSTGRKPVGKASVELIFDNSDGKAPGQYATYAEIAIKREASRDGQSEYYLNKTRCRRKDITDIFLGTGLGPRAYSIIEQGMITRIVEAKPEDLRVFFEEAAGVSRYKERRRETETRIKHARENLERVEDIRKELETQINRLQRQSKAAEKYKDYKQNERLLRAQLLGLKWRDLSARIEQHDRLLASCEIAHEEAQAGHRALDAEIETLRQAHVEANDRFNEIQGRFYALGADISGLEQAIEHARAARERIEREYDETEHAWREANAHLDADRAERGRLAGRLAEGAPRVEQLARDRAAADAALAEAEAAMQRWQAEWESFTGACAQAAKARDVLRARAEALKTQLAQLDEHEVRLDQEAAALSAELGGIDLDALKRLLADGEQACARQEQELERLEAAQTANAQAQEALQTELTARRGEAQELKARLASLEELQAAALGHTDATLKEWLAQHGWQTAPRLARLLNVDAGWEKAVERVLGAHLSGIEIEGLEACARELVARKHAGVTLFEAPRGGDSPGARDGDAPRLLDKVKCRLDLRDLLGGVYAVEDVDVALRLRASLRDGESVVTRGGLWLGRHWLSLPEESDVRAGMIARERERVAIEERLAALTGEIDAALAHLRALQAEQGANETARAQCRRALNDYQRDRAAAHSAFGHQEARRAQLGARAAALANERVDLQARADAARADAARLADEGVEIERAYDALEAQRAGRLDARETLKTGLENARTRAQECAEVLHRLEIEREGMQTRMTALDGGIQRLSAQLAQSSSRREELQRLLADGEEPGAAQRERLEALLAQRVEMEARLAQARKETGDVHAALQAKEQARGQQEHRIEEARAALERERLTRQELSVRRDTIAEQLREAGFRTDEVLTTVAPDATEEACQTELDQLLARIERLGPINLVAIQEFEEQSSRKLYLDKQHDDLMQALATLEEAIRKMDRETRSRFKDTFDKVNAGFQSFFPQLFGGGSAYLELIGDDLLTTGVGVMARPPGKRNSTIHLLSGGEKALTAVALVFAIFELNPAPFCLLDEVDAPLDDANVQRYAQTLKTLAKRSQLIYITHNKTSMEAAEVLLGVTMSEPGVSRLVAVDVGEALEMVAS